MICTIRQSCLVKTKEFLNCDKNGHFATMCRHPRVTSSVINLFRVVFTWPGIDERCKPSRKQISSFSLTQVDGQEAGSRSEQKDGHGNNRLVTIAVTDK